MACQKWTRVAAEGGIDAAAVFLLLGSVGDLPPFRRLPRTRKTLKLLLDLSVLCPTFGCCGPQGPPGRRITSGPLTLRSPISPFQNLGLCPDLKISGSGGPWAKD